MFRFENPIYLWLLLIIPILIIMKIMMWYVQRKKLSRIGNPTLLKELMPDVSRFRPWVKFLLLIFIDIGFGTSTVWLKNIT